MKYVYQVTYIDSILPDIEDASSTEIHSPGPVSKQDAIALLKEQLEENGIHVDWLKLVKFAQVP